MYKLIATAKPNGIVKFKRKRIKKSSKQKH